MKNLAILLGALLISHSASAAIEYGLFEKSSDGKFQSLCPIRDDGAVVCTYTYGFQSVTVAIDQINVGAHQQNLRSLEALGPMAFYTYDETIRKMLPTTNFLLNGFYIKFDSRTILLDFAHFHTPISVVLPANVKSTMSSVLTVLLDVYYTHLVRINPFVKRTNQCPVLTGKFQCQNNSLIVTQMNYGMDDLYVFTYSDRPAPFDFAANDAGMKNASDKFVATCSAQTVSLDGSKIKLTGIGKDLEFTTDTNSMVCRRVGNLFGR